MFMVYPHEPSLQRLLYNKCALSVDIKFLVKPVVNTHVPKDNPPKRCEKN